MLYPNFGHGDDGDDWTGAPDGTVWQRWGAGVVLAAGFGWSGVKTLWTGETDFTGSHAATMHVTGHEAIAMGIASLGAAVFLFCHYFIQSYRPLAWYAVLGKIAALVSFIGGTFVFMIIWLVRGH